MKKTILWVSIFLLYPIERYFIYKQFPKLSSAIKLHPSLKLFDYEVPMPMIGYLTFLILILVAVVIIYLPYKNFKNKSDWRNLLKRIYNTILIYILIPFAIVFGNWTYTFFKDNVGDKFNHFVTSFGVAFSPSIFGRELPKLDGTIASILGIILIIWAYNKVLKKKL